MRGIPNLTTFAWVFFAAVITIFIVTTFVKSRHGRAVIAIREAEIAAEASGINTTSVSYTHLDVYKRQPLTDALLVSWTAAWVHGLSLGYWDGALISLAIGAAYLPYARRRRGDSLPS